VSLQISVFYTIEINTLLLLISDILVLKIFLVLVLV